MAKWGLLISVGLVVLALFLGSGFFTYYAGDVYWESDKAGILSGVIHGVLAPLFLVAQIFSDYTMYELNNSGWWYNLGFLIGLLSVWGGSTKGTKHIVKNYYHMPSHGSSKKGKLTKEAHEHISKVVEEKVDAKLFPKKSGKKKVKKSLKKGKKKNI
tara:strand:+ start:597 stop:1067 length:471 start_codon:yes stop_codon:yes gene_type:complete